MVLKNAEKMSKMLNGTNVCPQWWFMSPGAVMLSHREVCWWTPGCLRVGPFGSGGVPAGRWHTAAAGWVHCRPNSSSTTSWLPRPTLASCQNPPGANRKMPAQSLTITGNVIVNSHTKQQMLSKLTNVLRFFVFFFFFAHSHPSVQLLISFFSFCSQS